jgi:SAM-dependent methyltransferase
MAQNIYDDATFFAAYSDLPRSRHGLAGAPEWASLQSLLRPVAGARVVDLGCGFGWFCRWAAEHGAASVVGIDLSERMLDRARAETTDAAVRYERADLDHVELAPGSADLVYSSLTLHYVVELDHLLTQVGRALVPGGALVCSMEHPVATAPSVPQFVADPAGRTVWPLDRYLDEGPRTTDWLAPGVVKQHRTIGTYVRALARAGLVLVALEEWGPSPEQVAEVPEWASERERPPFLLVSAVRPGGNRPTTDEDAADEASNSHDRRGGRTR